MSNKRCRFQHSPSLRDVCLLDQVRPIESSAKLEVLHCASNASRSFALKFEKSRESMFTLGLTVGDYWEWGTHRETSFEESLKSCYICSKGIGETDDIYMYNDLGAFCSSECRHKQIAEDNFHKGLAKKRPHSSSTLFNFTHEDLDCSVDLNL